MNETQIQQGDIRLERVDALPAGCKLIKRTQHGVILAESQLTNNRHFLPSRKVQLFEAPDKTRYLVNEGDQPAELLHSDKSEGHLPLLVSPGVHQVGDVREKDHLAGMSRPVVD